MYPQSTSTSYRTDAPSPSLHGAPALAVDGEPAETQPGYVYQTTVHPCFIDGRRTLVHRRGLAATAPSVFRRLADFAARHGFALQEDRRKRELSCRDERRRMAPLLMFAAGLASATAMADEKGQREEGVSVVPTIDVVAERHDPDKRKYLIEAGKRFVSKPHGSVDLILGIAAEVRAKGAMQRVSTRGMQMPSEYGSSFVDRYDYTMPATCGGGTFSYYEGEGFTALGYHAEHGQVVLDVLSGGGPFTGPRLWGAYDQVLNANVRMDLMFGDGEKDGMGLLHASYKIGLMPVMRTATKNYYGDLYARAVADSSECTSAAPTVRQAAAPAQSTNRASVVAAVDDGG